jgi:hypothetical protein
MMYTSYMLSLTQVSNNTKKVTVIAIGVVIVSILLRILIAFLGFIGYIITSNAPLSAQSGFGQIPNISVNALTYNHAAGMQFVLNTTNGGYPSEPTVADVYKYTQQNVSLLSLDDASRTAQSFGFTGQYSEISNQIYQWTNGSRTFVYNIQTNQFNLSTANPYTQIGIDASTQETQFGSFALTQAGAEAAAKNIIQNLQVSSDYNLTNPVVTYLSFGSNNLATTQTDVATANAVEVNYYRYYRYQRVNASSESNANTLQLMSDNPLIGSISLIIDNDQASQTSGVIGMNFSDWQLDNTNFSTYSIKNPEQAWQDVQNGNAYLVYLNAPTNAPFAAYSPQTVAKFEAENISLAYFDGMKQQEYLEPIYVISGIAILTDGSTVNFSFYDPAVI